MRPPQTLDRFRHLALAGAIPFITMGVPCTAAEHVQRGNDLYRIAADGEWLVTDVVSFRAPNGVDAVLRDASLDRYGLVHLRSNRLGIHDVRVAAGADRLALVRTLAARDDVVWAELNYRGTYCGANDPLYADQWALNNIGQSGGVPDADVDAPEAWLQQIGQGSIVIAVLDSGTEIDHDDLAPLMWKNVGEVPDNQQDDDQNGFVDDYDGWDFFNGDNEVDGVIGHGTMVAGIICGKRNNQIGITGLAAGDATGRGCTVMPLGVGDRYPETDILDDAILYAADNGARIITMSLAGGETTAINEALVEAYDGAGVFIDCAAGNNGGSVSYPARHPAVMAVAATDRDDERASFSNPGNELEVAAPGKDILSTTLNNGYTSGSGTSFAAPYVAALAGLVLSERPCLSNDQVRAVIRASVDDVETPGYDELTGDGRINAAAAVALAGITPCFTCTGDLDGDGIVAFTDLLTLLSAWGPCPGCAADLNGDDTVDFSDLIALLAAWGPCP